MIKIPNSYFYYAMPIIELVWHSCKEYIAHRLFQSVDELKQLLDRLLNQGELVIK
jgi:hypothetical protein